MVYAMQAIGEYKQSDQASSLKQRDYKDATDLIVIGGGNVNARAQDQVLRILRETYGEEKVLEWGAAIMDTLQQADVLRQELHEKSISGKAKSWDELDDNTLPRPKLVAGWLLRDLREREEHRCTSQGWESAEQCAVEPTESMQELPHENPPTCKEMFDMWRQGKGLRVLQQALYKIQEIRKSIIGEWEGGDCMKEMSHTVRRLTPL